MNAEIIVRSSHPARFPLLGNGFLWRALMVSIFVILTHQFAWGWLRFVTSEAVLRLSASLGLETERISIDTIRVHAELFRFVVSCTFVDVFTGTIPLAWNFNQSITRNLFTIIGLAFGLFSFNIARLEMGQLLYVRGAPWILADQVLGGFAYFAVWLVIVYRFSGNWSEGERASCPAGGHEV